MDRPSVLVIDDKDTMLRLLERILSPSYAVHTVSDGAKALALLATQTFDVVVTDVRMPGADGFEVLRAVKRHSPATEVLMMTAYASVQHAVEAMKEGAYDYIQKPFDPDDVSLVIARAILHKQSRDRADGAPEAAFGALIGKSAAMRAVYELCARAAGLDITVLLTGETGTGKELAARGIHQASARSQKPFVAVNCGALPSELVESELFGHAKGAFTGAVHHKEGLVEQAHGGTLFLDEMGELPLSAQVKLNRVLQDREVRRVGSTEPSSVDVRVIAATHRDLRAEVAQGRFREDLFFRLHVFPIRLPPLRERSEDIPILAAHFARRYARAFHRQVTAIEPDALALLSRCAWPGNVRELENAMERAVAMAQGTRITMVDLPAELREPDKAAQVPEPLAHLPYRETIEQARDRVSREYLTALMREFGGNVTRAAERAGMERESLHRLLKRYGVRSDAYKP